MDLVLGHHAHAVQGLLQRDSKVIFFGQGNFFFHPYPYAGFPGGVLYGPEAVKNRIEQLGSLEMRIVAYDDYRGTTHRPFEDAFKIDDEKRRLET